MVLIFWSTAQAVAAGNDPGRQLTLRAVNAVEYQVEACGTLAGRTNLTSTLTATGSIRSVTKLAGLDGQGVRRGRHVAWRAGYSN